MTWFNKWEAHLVDGFYYDLLAMGRIKKEEDFEPNLLGFEFYIKAFRELNTCRQQGLGIAPIPFLAIDVYWNRFGVEDFEDFLYFIRLMDDTYLKLESNKLKNKSEGNNVNSN